MATDQPITTYSDFLKALLSDRERFFEEVVEGVALGRKLRYAIVTIITLSGFFGLVAGAYSGPAQAVSAGVKLPFLFFATFAVCFPAFFVVQVLVGSRLRLLQVAVLVFGALALTCAFVGVQLAWSLRPFLGDRNKPFRVFGSYQGNFYAAIIYAVNKLLQGEEKPTAPPGTHDTIPRFRGFIIPPIDTAADSTHGRKRP